MNRISIILISLLLAACSRQYDEPVIAWVDKTPIFESALPASDSLAAFKSLSVNEKRELIRQVAADQALLLDARARNYDRRPEVKLPADRLYHKTMVDKFVNSLVWKPVLSDTSLQRTYERLSKAVGFSHLIVGYQGALKSDATRTKQQARELVWDIRRQIQQDGISFESAVLTWSEEPFARESKGYFGFIYWGQMLPEIIYAIWDEEDTGLQEPIESDFGFHLVHIHGFKAVPRPSFEENKNKIAQDILQGKLPEFKRELKILSQNLFIEYDVELFKDNITLLFNQLDSLRGDSGARVAFKSIKLLDIDYQLPLGRIGKQEVTLEWFFAQADLEPMILESLIVYRNSLRKLLADIISRHLAAIKCEKINLVDKDRLNRQIKELTAIATRQLYIREQLQKSQFMTEEVLVNRSLMQHKIVINEKYLGQ